MPRKKEPKRFDRYQIQLDPVLRATWQAEADDELRPLAVWIRIMVEEGRAARAARRAGKR